MSSLTRSAPLSPFEAESAARIFCRFMLRLAVLAGLACSLLVWSVGPIVVAVCFVVVVAMLTAMASLRHARGAHALRAGLVTARVSVQVLAALAVVDLAGFPGVLAVVVCLGLSESVRGLTGRLGRRALQRVYAGS